MAEAVVLVPGIMGSQLHQGQNLIWPGSPAELLFPYGKMKELLDPDLQVGDIIRSVAISNQYDSLVEALGLCGFDESGDRPTLLVCPYDWRKDNRLAAARLADKVKALRDAHGTNLQIDIVAHSMGGLVSRYFLESGVYSETNCPGFANVRRLVTIGTPHRGAPLALCAALGQVKRLFLNATQVKQLADQSDFPSLYQLMPPESEPFLWNTDMQARLDPANPYLENTAKFLGLNASNLQSAALFHASLNVATKPKTIAYFCFVGTRQNTISNVQGNFAITESNGAINGIGPHVTGVEISDGGDGTVPSWSASFVGMQQLAVGGDHGGLYKAPEVLRTLGALLGKQGVLSSLVRPDQVRLSLRDEVVAPEEKAPIVMFFNTAPSLLEAELVMRKLTGSDGKEMAKPVIVQRLSVTYKGAPIDSLALTMDAPEFSGIYELDLHSCGSSVAENKPRLMVQQD